MAEAAKGNTVRIHYTGYLDSEEQFDSSVGGDPLEFTLGEQQVIPGFEKEVLGMDVGDTKTFSIEPENGYGPHQDQLIMVVERSQLPEHITPEVGMNLQAQQKDGQTLNLTVTDLSGEKITLDANHPLAGERLTFEVELVEVVD